MATGTSDDIRDLAEAGRLEGLVRRAVEAGRAAEALGHIDEAARLAEGSSSSLVVTTYLLCVLRAASLASSGKVDALDLARGVVDRVEPWFGADIEQFAEVAEGARHAALHALMHHAAGAGRLEDAITIRRLDEAGNVRCRRRWEAEALFSSPGCHALYPNAYGDAQLVGHLLAARRFEDVPPLLDRLAALTQAPGVQDETRDACGEEEAGALLAVMGSADVPSDLAVRAFQRLEEIAAAAVPTEAWPRTLARLSAR